MAKRSSKASAPALDHSFLLSGDETDPDDPRPTAPVASEQDIDDLLTKDVPMGTRVVLANPKLFFHWMDHLGQKPVAQDDRKRYYFRGERSAEYDLIPSMLRNQKFERLKGQHRADNPLELQKKLLDRYKRYTQHLIHADHDFDAPINDDFDTLCLAQHYGLPTLLLDWTLNPFVAAFFAGSGVTPTLLREKLAIEDRITKYWIRIWVMRLKAPKDREHQTVHLEDRGQTHKWNSDLGRTGMIPDGPKIVVPLVFTRRIASQVGRFVYCGYMTDDYSKGDMRSLTWFARKNPKKMPWDELYSLDVEFNIEGKKDWEKIRRTSVSETSVQKKECFVEQIDGMMRNLEFMGFHAGRLFPDLGGWAQYLADGNL